MEEKAPAPADTRHERDGAPRWHELLKSSFEGLAKDTGILDRVLDRLERAS